MISLGSKRVSVVYSHAVLVSRQGTKSIAILIGLFHCSHRDIGRYRAKAGQARARPGPPLAMPLLSMAK